MEKRNRNVMILSIVALVLVLVGVTYAYFSAQITGIESASTISLTAGRMGIVYSEGDENVTASNIYPKDDAWVTKTFTLTGYNTTNQEMKYNVGLNVTVNEFANNYLTYDLKVLESDSGTPVSEKTNVPINGTGFIKFGKGTFKGANGDKHTYELKIYFKDNGKNQNDAQNAVFNAKINVVEAKEEPEGWSSPTPGSLLAGIKSNNSKASSGSIPGVEPSWYPATYVTLEASEICNSTLYCNEGKLQYFPTKNDIVEWTNESYADYGTEYSNLVNKYIWDDSNGECQITNATASEMTYACGDTSITETESILSSTEDDYGTSYYYRGAVENNYVVFANMCWRIVRVDGQGNTKLVLYNYNPTGASNPCTESLDGETMAFARVNDSYTSKFNTNYNHNAYIGYMYGDIKGSTYEEVHANTNKSAILTVLMTWYDEKLRSYNDLLADTIWCNDKRVVTDTTYDPWDFGNILGTGINKDKTYYQTAKRLLPLSSALPSLKCGESAEDNKISKFTASDKINGNGALTFDGKEYKIGLLTADEIAFAGATAGTTFSSANKEYYLYKNASSSNWWTLSPLIFSGHFARIWFMIRGNSLDSYDIDDGLGVRPAVSLKSTASITSGGNGTQSNPFVVQ